MRLNGIWLLPFLGGGFSLGGLAFCLQPFFFALAPAADFFLSFTHGMASPFGGKSASFKPAHYIRDGVICQYGRSGGKKKLRPGLKVKARNERAFIRRLSPGMRILFFP
jgi:hypothetical protein